MSELTDRDAVLASIVPRDMGAVEGLTFFRNVTRTISSEEHMVRVRDRDADGRPLADIGYSPAKAIAVARLLVAAALRSDPTLVTRAPECEG